ncbi:hypothetical protein EAI_13811, partial [Harpegnathos saltator]
FLAKHNTVVMPQPPYSPRDMAPCDFFLFPKLQKTLKGQRFSTIGKVKAKSRIHLKTISKEAFVTPVFLKLETTLAYKCIISQRDYFE